jgi:hypothetical protein
MPSVALRRWGSSSGAAGHSQAGADRPRRRARAGHRQPERWMRTELRASGGREGRTDQGPDWDGGDAGVSAAVGYAVAGGLLRGGRRACQYRDAAIESEREADLVIGHLEGTSWVPTPGQQIDPPLDHVSTTIVERRIVRTVPPVVTEGVFSSWSVGRPLLEAVGRLTERLPDRRPGDPDVVLPMASGARGHRLDRAAEDGPLGADRAVRRGPVSTTRPAPADGAARSRE